MEGEAVKTFDDIFFASVRRGDDPCYALYLAEQYVARKRAEPPATASPTAGAVVTVGNGIVHDAGGVGFFPLAYTEVV